MSAANPRRSLPADDGHLAHPCRVRDAAGGAIDASWCLDAKADIVAGLPAELTAANVLREDQLLWRGAVGRRRAKNLEIYYAPFELVAPDARVVLVGVTPGRTQMVDALRAARVALRAGADGPEVLRRASELGSFSGPLGRNLFAMLDGIGLHRALGLGSSAQLFTTQRQLAAFTSAVAYPVIVRGSDGSLKDYNGRSPAIETEPILVQFITRVLARQLAATRPDALVIPLGQKAAIAVGMCVRAGAVRPDQCLLNFPHPSGANVSRVEEFDAYQAQMAAAVATWASS